ncbi:MAG: outer membrane protein transport protein [Pseudomonadota bacterium]
MHAAKLALAGIFCTTSAFAGGIDRSGQLINPLFRDGTYAEVTYGYSQPDMTGTDLITGGSTNNVAHGFDSPSFGFKTDITDQVSFSILGAEDYGADIRYTTDPRTSALGGTKAITNGYTITFLGRYKFNENFSVHGGLKVNRQDGQITLDGLAYGPLAGYNVQLDDDIGFGGVIGAAYERKEIGLRVALTYNSKIRHEFDTNETQNGMPLGPQSTTTTDMPQSVNLDFQTGVAPDWLVFGTIRWAEFSEFLVEPVVFERLTGVGLVELEDVVTYTLGVAHQFNENWAASVAYIYEEPGERLISPLSPYTGWQAVQLGARYSIQQWELSAIFRYSMPGNAVAGVGSPTRTPRAEFDDNRVVTGAFRVAYNF